MIGLGALLLAPLMLLAQIQDEVAAVNPYAPALAPRPHDWLLYVAMGLSLLNLVLVYMLYRSPDRTSASNGDPASESGHGSRTEKRIEKRKREIDELRQQIDDLSHRVVAESHSHLNVQQIQELVRTLVKDELNRHGTANSSVR